MIEVDPKNPAIRAGLAWLRKYSRYLPPGTQTKPCKRCNAPIFFARRLYGGKWTTIEPYPIHDSAVILDAVGIAFTSDGPIIEDPAPGIQWVPHYVLCGLTERPVGPLGELWDKLHAVPVEKVAKGVRGLMEVLEQTE